MNWYLKVLKQYTDFNGRARRKEYWMFVLFNLIFATVAMILDKVLIIPRGELPFGVFYFLYILLVLIPGLSVSIRRLHDVGKSGWMILISLIPLVGSIWLLILLFSDSEPNENKYGANPKKYQDVESFSNELTGDTVILSYIIWSLISTVLWPLLAMANPDALEDIYDKTYKIVQVSMSLIWPLVFTGLAFVIKDKSKRNISFIIVGITLIYVLYNSFIKLMVKESDWMILIALIPFAVAFWLIAFIIKKSRLVESKLGTISKTIPEGGLDFSPILKVSVDLIVFIIVTIIFVSNLFWVLIDIFNSNESIRILQLITGIIGLLLPIGLAFAITDKSKRIISFVIGGIIFIIGIFHVIMRFKYS